MLFALIMASISFFYTHFRYPIFHYSYILWLTIAVIRFMAYRKYIYLRFKNKPVLAIDAISINDLAKGINYYWKDINEVYEESSNLVIDLQNTTGYLQQVKNPIKRFLKYLNVELFNGKPLYYINLDLVNVNISAFLEILNDYSIQSQVE